MMELRSDDVVTGIRAAILVRRGGDVGRIVKRTWVLGIGYFVGNGVKRLSVDHSGRNATCEGLDLFANVEKEGIGAPMTNKHNSEYMHIVQAARLE